MKIKYLQTQVTQYGKTVYYFRRDKKSPRIRLPDPTSPEFEASYEAACEGINLKAPVIESQVLRRRKRTEQEKFIRSVEIAAKTSVYRAKSRASRRGMEFSLSYKWAMDTIREQDHKCQLTWVPFDHKYSTKGHMKPFSPSIDRIDNSKGYTPENCRMVLSCVNIMLSDWGTDVFEFVIRQFGSKQRRNERSLRNSLTTLKEKLNI